MMKSRRDLLPKASIEPWHQRAFRLVKTAESNKLQPLIPMLDAPDFLGDATLLVRCTPMLPQNHQTQL
jgi:hypothetical protein